jgi:D-arabinose 5-phosphate isomerase GutQ
MTHAADGSEWARRTMARALVVTAPPDAPVPRAADVTIGLPAPTMADDRGDQASMLPMGTRCE